MSAAHRTNVPHFDRALQIVMVPVVFLVLPITILFALYPGLLAITTVAQ